MAASPSKTLFCFSAFYKIIKSTKIEITASFNEIRPVSMPKMKFKISFSIITVTKFSNVIGYQLS